MGRGTTQGVELVEDDDRGRGTPAPDRAGDRAVGGSGQRGWSPRRRLALGAGLLAVLVAAGGVAELGVAARERARLTAVADLPNVLPRLDGPPEVLWSADDDFLPVTGAAGHLLVGTTVDPGTGPRARAVEAGTGTVVWELALLPAPDRVAAPEGAEVWSSPGHCWSEDPDADVVLCAADNGATVLSGQDHTVVPPTVHRVLLLDARDGSVLTDLSDTAPGYSVQSLAARGDLVLLTHLDDERAHLAAVRPDGTVAWRTSVPAVAGEDGSTVGALPLGDGAVLWTSDRLHVLDAGGATVRTLDLGPDSVVDTVAPDTVVVANRTWAGDGTTTVVRQDGDVVHDGQWVPRGFDDASTRIDVLTMHAGALHAFARDGTRLWSADLPWPSEAVVLDGRVHLASHEGVVTLDPRTGAELWRTSDLWSSTPLLTDGDLLLVAAASDRVETGGILLVALDRTDGSEVWRSPTLLGVDHVGLSAGVITGYGWLGENGSGGPIMSVLG